MIKCSAIPFLHYKCRINNYGARQLKVALIKIILSLYCFSGLTAQEFSLSTVETGLDKVRNTCGIAVADYDQDGDLDIFLTGYFNFDLNTDTTWSRLMRNNGSGFFEDITVESGLSGQYINTSLLATLGEKLGASWGDYDNDGFPDLFLSNSREDQLFHNEGNGTFTDVTSQAGVGGCDNCYSASGMWFDYNKDGFLDLYVSNLKGSNTLFENNQDGSFSNVTERMNVGGESIVSWSSVAIDLGKDGFWDIYNANDTQLNELFENRSGVHYNESSRAYGVGDEIGASMGIAVGDYNNDGFFDLYVSNIHNHHPNPLFKNLGNRRFTNVANELQVENAGWAWGVKFFDYDHDGDEDLATVNGVVSKQFFNGMEQMDERNYFYKNLLIENDEEGFIDWSEESGTNTLDRARGLEVFDYDGDGDLDMIVSNIHRAPYFYVNQTNDVSSTNTNWLQVRLEGTISNRSAFGTEVKIVTEDGQALYRWHHGAGIYGQSIKPVHFGIGEANRIDTIRISWPSGLQEYYYDLDVNQTINVKENDVLTSTDDLAVGPVKFEVNHFPNPFDNHIVGTIEFNPNIVAENVSYSIYDNLGRTVYRRQFKNQSNKIEILWDGKSVTGNYLLNGMYFYVLDVDGQVLSGKLIKN